MNGWGEQGVGFGRGCPSPSSVPPHQNFFWNFYFEMAHFCAFCMLMMGAWPPGSALVLIFAISLGCVAYHDWNNAAIAALSPAITHSHSLNKCASISVARQCFSTETIIVPQWGVVVNNSPTRHTTVSQRGRCHFVVILRQLAEVTVLVYRNRYLQPHSTVPWCVGTVALRGAIDDSTWPNSDVRLPSSKWC